MKTKPRENWYQSYLAKQSVYDFLKECDKDLGQKCQTGGCQWCGEGKLHRADYPRKPRGGPEIDGEIWRDSFCCNLDGCRKRHTLRIPEQIGHPFRFDVGQRPEDWSDSSPRGYRTGVPV